MSEAGNSAKKDAPASTQPVSTAPKAPSSTSAPQAAGQNVPNAPQRSSVVQTLQYDGEVISEKVPMLFLKECNQTVQDLKNELSSDERVRAQEFLPANAASIGKQITPCLMIASVSENGDIVKYLNLLRTIKDDVKQNRIKFLVFSKIKNPAIVKTFESHGCHEYILEPIAKKSLMFKIGLHIKALHSQRKKIRENALRKDEDVKIKAGGKKEATENNAGGKEEGFKKAPAQEKDSDAWVFKGNKPKKAGGKWTMRMKGPDPSKGKWLEVGKKPDGSSQWRFLDNETAKKVEKEQKKGKPLEEALKEAGAEKGGWEWEGDQPQHNNGDWNFSSAKPNLTCYNADGSKSHSKVEIDQNGEIVAAEDSKKALAKVAEMEAVQEADKAKKKKNIFASDAVAGENKEKNGDEQEASTESKETPEAGKSAELNDLASMVDNSLDAKKDPKKLKLEEEQKNSPEDFVDKKSEKGGKELSFKEEKTEETAGKDFVDTKSKQNGTLADRRKEKEAEKSAAEHPEGESSSDSEKKETNKKKASFGSSENVVEKKRSRAASDDDKVETEAEETEKGSAILAKEKRGKTPKFGEKETSDESKTDERAEDAGKQKNKTLSESTDVSESSKKKKPFGRAESTEETDRKAEEQSTDTESRDPKKKGVKFEGEKNAEKKKANAQETTAAKKRKKLGATSEDASEVEGDDGSSANLSDLVAPENGEATPMNVDLKEDKPEGGWSHHKSEEEKKKKWKGRDSDQSGESKDDGDKLIEIEQTARDINVKKSDEEIFEYPHDHFGVLSGTWERVEDPDGDWFVYVDPAIRTKKDYNFKIVKNWWTYRGAERPAYLAPIKMWQFRKVRPEKTTAFDKLPESVRDYLQGLVPGAKREKTKKAEAGVEAQNEYKFVAPMGVLISVSEFSQNVALTGEKIVELFCKMVGDSLKGASVAVFRLQNGQATFVSAASDLQKKVASKCSAEKKVFIEKQGIKTCLAVVVFDANKSTPIGGVIAEVHADQSDFINSQSSYLSAASVAIRGCILDTAVSEWKQAA